MVILHSKYSEWRDLLSFFAKALLYLTGFVIFMFVVSIIKFFLFKKRQIDKLKILSFLSDKKTPCPPLIFIRAFFQIKI